MKVIGNNHGIVEVDKLYSSFAVEHMYFYKNGEKRFVWCAEVIPDLKVYSRYFDQQNWLKYDGSVYYSDTCKEINPNFKGTYQSYAIIGNEIIPADYIEFIGNLKMKIDSEYYFRIKKGRYQAYFHNFENRIILDLNGEDIAVFEVEENIDYYYFELEPMKYVCWHKDSGIENTFFSSNPNLDIAKRHRQAKIRSLIK